MERRKRRAAIDGLLLACLLGVAAPAGAETSDPPFWPEEVTSRIGGAAERAGTSALVVVHRGEVVLEWGVIARRLAGKSLRKSLLSALIGIAVDRGLLDIGRPVGSFDLPEGGKLNEVEPLEARGAPSERGCPAGTGRASRVEQHLGEASA